MGKGGKKAALSTLQIGFLIVEKQDLMCLSFGAPVKGMKESIKNKKSEETEMSKKTGFDKRKWQGRIMYHFSSTFLMHDCLALPQNLPQVLGFTKALVGNMHQHLLALFFVFSSLPPLL
jgi:hypothetical protein